jgi:hypothetical protein
MQTFFAKGKKFAVAPMIHLLFKESVYISMISMQFCFNFSNKF